MKPLIGESSCFLKTTEKALPDLSERQKNSANVSSENSPNELDAQDSPKRGDGFIVPEISQDDARIESLSP